MESTTAARPNLDVLAAKRERALGTGEKAIEPGGVPDTVLRTL